MTTPELKPCPFCGVPPVHEGEFFVHNRKDCDLFLSLRAGNEKDIAAWNTRAPQPQSVDRAKALELAALDELHSAAQLHANCDDNNSKYYYQAYETIRADLTARQWLPIESAPRDGTGVICFLPYGGGFVTQTWWHVDERGGVWFAEGGEICPTHWMPLPAPPQTEKGVE